MDNKKKVQAKILLIGAGGIIGIYFLSTFFINTYRSLDALGQSHLSGLFAAMIGIVIFIVRRKFRTEQLEYYELLMLIIIGVTASINLLPPDVFNSSLVIVLSIIVLVGGFVYFGLGKYLGDEKKIAKIEFIMMLLFFIGLTIIIIAAFNIIRVNDLFNPPSHDT